MNDASINLLFLCSKLYITCARKGFFSAAQADNRWPSVNHMPELCAGVLENGKEAWKSIASLDAFMEGSLPKSENVSPNSDILALDGLSKLPQLFLLSVWLFFF